MWPFSSAVDRIGEGDDRRGVERCEWRQWRDASDEDAGKEGSVKERDGML
jgi:hypothetical protein